jgi:hypothetical protein
MRLIDAHVCLHLSVPLDRQKKQRYCTWNTAHEIDHSPYSNTPSMGVQSMCSLVCPSVSLGWWVNVRKPSKRRKSSWAPSSLAKYVLLWYCFY